MLQLDTMITSREPLIGHRYQLHEKIGQGRMGSVFRATDRLTGQIVALKRVLLPGETEDVSHFGTDTNAEQIRLAITREFQTLATLRHPNVISVRDYGFDAQTEKYGDMFKAGIIDPAKVVRTALQDAASIAGLLVTTEAMVAELPKKDAPAMPQMPGGGMDF